MKTKQNKKEESKEEITAEQGEGEGGAKMLNNVIVSGFRTAIRFAGPGGGGVVPTFFKSGCKRKQKQGPAGEITAWR